MSDTTLFGTDGIRALVGEFCFTDSGITKLAHAISAWVTEKYGPHASIIIGHDTRSSVHWVKYSLCAALNRHGHHTYDAGTVPTPTLCWLVQHIPTIDCGIIISASHNSWHYNGIKICDKKSGKITAIDEQHISALWHEPNIPALEIVSFGNAYAAWDETERYKEALRAHFAPNLLQGMTIVLDCAHGAMSVIAPLIFRSLGAHVVTCNNNPNGTNINDGCGALHPAHLQSMVLMHNADSGFAFDGDGDRVIAVSKDGTIRDGDDIIALLSTHPRYTHEETIVGTVMSNYGFESWLQKQGKTLLRTAVGDKYVSQALSTHNLTLGGEQSGHIIMHDFLYTGDGIFTALRIVETMIITNNRAFSSFTKYPQVLINVPLTAKNNVSEHDLELLVSTHEKELTNGRIVLRISGTEPLVRVMVEDEQAACAQQVATMVATQCQKLLSLSR
jgi:phosphoglucosamine mutase